MEQSELLCTATDVAYALLCSGAEIYRVEEAVLRIFDAYGVSGGSVFAIPSLLIVSIRHEDSLPLTNIRRIRENGTDVEKIRACNDLCRRICAQRLSAQQIRQELDIIAKKPTYTFGQILVAYAVVSFGFTLVFGGGLLDAVAALIAGAAVKLTLHQLEKYDTNFFFTTILASFVAAAVASLCVVFGLGAMPDKIIIGTLMLLVPGTALTSSMRDIMAGDLIAGLTRLATALIIATGIALGAGFALTLLRTLGVA